ncbi:hypothetical protein DTW92_05545 [Paracoccus pantotrophus]|nr:hypothetical protein DTW92_05545 [Paracoccus pantotrophus]RNI14949.1 hypothetical protein EB844_18695 [Paracoccus pantotrophus]
MPRLARQARQGMGLTHCHGAQIGAPIRFRRLLGTATLAATGQAVAAQRIAAARHPWQAAMTARIRAFAVSGVCCRAAEAA